MTIVHIQSYSGSRLALLPLFRLADESDLHIKSYSEIGHVLVARDRGSIVGMVQMAAEHDFIEVVSLSVMPEHQRRGIGTQLLREAAEYCQLRSVSRLIVCTGSWETENILYYQKRGFEIFNTVRDFFTSEKGYDRTDRDQVQLERRL